MKCKVMPLTVILVAAAAIGLFAWKDSLSTLLSATDDPAVVESSALRPVPTVRVREATREDTRVFPGTVRAVRRVELSFSVDGLLEELDVREGQRIEQGRVLARLDPRDFRHALDAATARYHDAKRALERAGDLFGRKVYSQAKYDAAKTAYEVAAADLRIKSKALEDTVLYAPFDGVVSKRYVENREHVKARTPVIGFKNIAMIEVVIRVPEKVIARGGTDRFREIGVRFDADDSKWFGAQVREYSVQSDPVSRTYEVVVGLHEPEDLDIFPGMTASVQVTSPRQGGAGKALVVPVEAVLSGHDGQSYVWVIPDEGGSPRKMEVTPGAFCNQGVEILQGLNGDERVAVAGVHTLREEMAVRPAREGKEGLDI